MDFKGRPLMTTGAPPDNKLIVARLSTPRSTPMIFPFTRDILTSCSYISMIRMLFLSVLTRICRTCPCFAFIFMPFKNPGMVIRPSSAMEKFWLVITRDPRPFAGSRYPGLLGAPRNLSGFLLYSFLVL